MRACIFSAAVLLASCRSGSGDQTGRAPAETVRHEAATVAADSPRKQPPVSNDEACTKELLTTIGAYKVWSLTPSVVAFTAKIDIDADGSPRAYGPGGKGLDHLANAGKPGHWVGIIADKNGHPVIQQEGDPYPGYYVSPTTLQERSLPKENPHKYVNAEEIPFIVLPGGVSEPGRIKVGDLAYVVNTANGKSSFAIFADCGPEGKLGEASIYLANQLGVNSNPRSGGTDKPVIRYYIFKSSGKGGHTLRTKEEIEADGAAALDKSGGKALLDCPGKE